MNGTRIPVWLLPSLVLTALLASYSIYKRNQVEVGNRATSLAVEYDVVQSLAASQGMPIDRAFADLKAQGVNSVVLSEETVGDLIYQGKATVQNGAILVTDAAAKARMDRGDAIRWGGEDGVQRAVPVGLLRQTPIGLDPEAADIARKAGMTIIARATNIPGATPEYIRGTLAWAHELGATVFLPMGDQVLGRRDALDATEDSLRQLGMLYASPEFTKLGGDENLVKDAPEIVVRLHSAQAAELDKLPMADAIDRYARAARERNMRILLIRPVSFAGQQPVNALVDFAKNINDQIRSEGGSIGVAKPFTESFVPKWLFLLIALSVVPVGYFVGSAFVKNRVLQIVGVALLTLLAGASLLHSGKPLMALWAAMLYPIAAFLVLDARNGKNIVLEFLIVSLISLVGGLVVAGLLNGLPFFIRAEVFPGVKVAVFLPIVVIGVYLFWRLADMRGALRSPITWSAALLALLLLGALAFMVSRTGNDNPAGVSDLELKLRNVLDALLFVRPRTKEFLVGHPLLILGIGMLIWQRKTGNKSLGGWTALALTAGAVGQTDVVNTMCHLHTPVLLSLERIGVGLVAGCIIGLVLWAVVSRFLPKTQQQQG